LRFYSLGEENKVEAVRVQWRLSSAAIRICV